MRPLSANGAAPACPNHEPITMSGGSAPDLDTRRRQIRFRSWHRGMQETDLILGRFADRHVERLSAEELDQFEALLRRPDPEIYNWIVGLEPVPAAHDTDLLRQIRTFIPGKTTSA